METLGFGGISLASLAARRGGGQCKRFVNTPGEKCSDGNGMIDSDRIKRAPS